mmetsp:Transcript_10206/g.16157  ORF Transcript_10206/g.16157 Transcript_10206/m.16157 type:complete len:230 (-) Transcript_10206:424-1113(-)
MRCVCLCLCLRFCSCFCVCLCRRLCLWRCRCRYHCHYHCLCQCHCLCFGLCFCLHHRHCDCPLTRNQPRTSLPLLLPSLPPPSPSPPPAYLEPLSLYVCVCVCVCGVDVYITTKERCFKIVGTASGHFPLVLPILLLLFMHTTNRTQIHIIIKHDSIIACCVYARAYCVFFLFLFLLPYRAIRVAPTFLLQRRYSIYRGGRGRTLWLFATLYHMYLGPTGYGVYNTPNI